MWGKRIAAAAALAVVAALGGVAPGAHADAPGDPVWGDVDGDGFRDRVFLGTIAPSSCSVIVEYGRPLGVLLPPVAYTYLRPGGTEVSCPDVGVAIQLSTDDIDQLVVGWSGGPPPSIRQNLLVLGRNFMPSFGLETFVSRPRFLDTTELNGDGRPDVYALSSRDRGFESYYSLGDGTLTISPMIWCAASVDVLLKDFNRDGAVGVLIAYTGRCADDSSGVVKLSSDGSTQILQEDPAGIRTWQIKIAYANDDSWADIRTRDLASGEVEYFIQAPRSGLGTFVESPTARQDKVTVRGDRATNLAVLDNDYATEAAEVTIVKQPRYGTAQVTSARTVVYRPGPARRTSDRFVYRVTEGAKSSIAAVNLRFTG